MGIGDEIMVSAQVKRLNISTGLPVLIVNRKGQVRFHEVWENNPRITYDPSARHVRLNNGPGMRPYIDHMTQRQFIWRKWDIEPGEIYLTQEEKDFAEPYRGGIVVEPHTKVPNGNKSWVWDRWGRVIRYVDFSTYQLGPPGRAIVTGAKYVQTTFRQACAVLSVSRAYLGVEGALHHAAAALGVPAVVLWPEFISPDITGYDTQQNIRHAGPPCGSRFLCKYCQASMWKITEDEVLYNLKKVLK